MTFFISDNPMVRGSGQKEGKIRPSKAFEKLGCSEWRPLPKKADIYKIGKCEEINTKYVSPSKAFRQIGAKMEPGFLVEDWTFGACQVGVLSNGSDIRIAGWSLQELSKIADDNQ